MSSISSDYRLDLAIREMEKEEEGAADTEPLPLEGGAVPDDDFCFEIDGSVFSGGGGDAPAHAPPPLPRRYLYVVKVSRVVYPGALVNGSPLPRLRMEPVAVQCQGEVSSLAQLLHRCIRAPSMTSFDMISYVTCVGVDRVTGALADVLQAMQDAHVELSEQRCGRFCPCAFPNGVTVDAGHTVSYCHADGVTDRVYAATMVCESYSLPFTVSEDVRAGRLPPVRGLMGLDERSVAEYCESGRWFVDAAEDRYVFYAHNHPYQPFTSHFV